jgi:predicted transcriptional regulator
MTKTIHVGSSLGDAARRFVDTVGRVERGEPVAAQDNVTFVTWSALASVMTDKRHELLRHLHSHPAGSIRALARDLCRDYKRVHADIAALAAVGLVERVDGCWRAEYDTIHTAITLVPPAA